MGLFVALKVDNLYTYPAPLLCRLSFVLPSRFGTSTVRYATFFAVGAVLAEFATNRLTDALWEANNSGKTFGSVDWSKFDPQDEDEEEEDGDDDDDDDDDDDE